MPALPTNALARVWPRPPASPSRDSSRRASALGIHMATTQATAAAMLRVAGPSKRKAEVFDVVAERLRDDLGQCVVVHRAIVVPGLGHVLVDERDRAPEVPGQVVRQVFQSQAVGDHATGFIAQPFQLVEPRAEGAHPGLVRVLGDRQDPLVPHEVGKRRLGQVLPARVCLRPVPGGLLAEVIARRRPAPGIANHREELQWPANLVGNVDVPVVVRRAQRYVGLQLEGVPDRDAPVLGDVDEVVAELALVKPMPANRRTQRRL